MASRIDWFNVCNICDVCSQSKEERKRVAKWWCERCDNNLCENCKQNHDAKHFVIVIEIARCNDMTGKNVLKEDDTFEKITSTVDDTTEQISPKDDDTMERIGSTLDDPTGDIGPKEDDPNGEIDPKVYDKSGQTGVKINNATEIIGVKEDDVTDLLPNIVDTSEENSLKTEATTVKNGSEVDARPQESCPILDDMADRPKGGDNTKDTDAKEDDKTDIICPKVEATTEMIKVEDDTTETIITKIDETTKVINTQDTIDSTSPVIDGSSQENGSKEGKKTIAPKADNTYESNRSIKGDTTEIIGLNKDDTIEKIDPKVEDTNEEICPKLGNTTEIVGLRKNDTADMIEPTEDDTTDMISPEEDDTTDMIGPKIDDISTMIGSEVNDTSEEIFPSVDDTSVLIGPKDVETSEKNAQRLQDTTEKIGHEVNDTTHRISNKPDDTTDGISHKPDGTSVLIGLKEVETSEKNGQQDTNEIIGHEVNDTIHKISKKPDDTTQNCALVDDAFKDSLSILLCKPRYFAIPKEPELEMVWEAKRRLNFFDVAFLPDGSLAAACYWDQKVVLYSNKGEVVHEYLCHFCPRFIASTPKNMTLLVGGSPGKDPKTILLEYSDELTKEMDMTLVETNVSHDMCIFEDDKIATVHSDSYINIQTMEGQLVSRIDTPGIEPWKIYEHSGCLYVMKYGAPGLLVYKCHEGHWVKDKDITEGLGQCGGAAIDDQGNIWVTDLEYKTLTTLNNEGKVLQRYRLHFQPSYISIHGTMLCVIGGSGAKRQLIVYKI